MKYVQMKVALAIINECDSSSITESDKELVIYVVNYIMKSLMEMGLVTTEMSIQYAMLKVSAWNDSYFCAAARQMCSLLYPAVNLCEKLFDN